MKSKLLSVIFFALLAISAYFAPTSSGPAPSAAWCAETIISGAPETELPDPAKELGLPDEYDNPNWKTGALNEGWRMDKTGRKTLEPAGGQVAPTRDKDDGPGPGSALESKIPSGECPEQD